MWRLRRRRRDDDRADEAVAAAEEQLEQVRQMRGDAEQVAAAHRRLRHHNHLADAVAEALRERR